MIDAGMNAILIKVAGIGLNIKHLGKALEEMRPTLTKLNNLYGSHICGEGGEYETLTLDCPLFKSRIVLKDVETVIHSDNDFATVAFLRIKDASLQPKEESADINVQIPKLLEDDFQVVSDVIEQCQMDGHGQPSETLPSTDPVLCISSARHGKWVAVANVQATVTKNLSIEEEVTRCLRYCEIISHPMETSPSPIVPTSTFFSPRWNYSPASTQFTPRSLEPALQHELALQLICPIQSESASIASHLLNKAYMKDRRCMCKVRATGLQQISDRTPKLLSAAERLGRACPSSYILAEQCRHLDVVRKGARVLNKDQFATELFVVVKSLPKNALVEKQVLVHTGRIAVPDDDEADEESANELVLKTVSPSLEQGDITSEVFTGHWEICHFTASLGSGCGLLCIRAEVLNATVWHAFGSAIKSISALQACWSHALSIRAFYRAELSIDMGLDLIGRTFDKNTGIPVTSIPCRVISTTNKDDWDMALAVTLS
ncbi:hypothetical protein D9758_008826 [Tetrapyrgos nigripes]|uniref:Diphthine--ammonia ligase n=1 Tax=Tetrapyrgos nigripes TaxID=182062 RepID=A0A8H5CLR5_9AGAR|nr:hypothetical protein D9758_008826 [Tetrapyrgos nigripes]